MACKCGPMGRNLWGSCCGLHNHLSGLPHKLGTLEIGTSTPFFTVGKVRPRAGEQCAQRYWLTHDRAGLEPRPLEVLTVDLLSGLEGFLRQRCWRGGAGLHLVLRQDLSATGQLATPQPHLPGAWMHIQKHLYTGPLPTVTLMAIVTEAHMNKCTQTHTGSQETFARPPPRWGRSAESQGSSDPRCELQGR